MTLHGRAVLSFFALYRSMHGGSRYHEPVQKSLGRRDRLPSAGRPAFASVQDGALAMPSLRVEHENLPGGDLALVRLVGKEPGPAGTATLELGKDLMLVIDAADPERIIEILLRAPVSDAVVELLSLLVGGPVDALHTDGGVIRITPNGDLRTAGRLAVLYLVRDAMPVPTHRGIWALEAAALAASIPSRICSEHALAALMSAHPDLEALHRQFPDAPQLSRVVSDLGQDAVDVSRVFDPLAALCEWFAQPGRQGAPDPLPSRLPVPGGASVSWDRVRPGLVDPREGAVECSVAGDHERRRISVRVPAQQAWTHIHEEQALFARVFDEKGELEFQSIPLTLDTSGTSYRGTAILAAGAGPGPFAVDISDGPDDQAPTEGRVRQAHARREAFRALFLERRAARDRGLADSVAESVSSRWQEAALEYDRLGDSDLAAVARHRAGSHTTGRIGPFLAELGIPADLLGGPPEPPQPPRGAG